MELFNLEFLHSQLFWTGLCFGLLLVVMWKFVLPALTETLDARANQIKTDLESAAQLKDEAEQSLRSYEKQLRTASDEAVQLVATARKEAEDLTAARAAELELELKRKAAAAELAIEQAKANAIADLRKEVVALTLLAAEKVLAAELDSSKVEKYTDEALSELSN
jgi:F-type H+-transporting ATPase subunit b